MRHGAQDNEVIFCKIFQNADDLGMVRKAEGPLYSFILMSFNVLRKKKGVKEAFQVQEYILAQVGPRDLVTPFSTTEMVVVNGSAKSTWLIETLDLTIF